MHRAPLLVVLLAIPIIIMVIMMMFVMMSTFVIVTARFPDWPAVDSIIAGRRRDTRPFHLDNFLKLAAVEPDTFTAGANINLDPGTLYRAHRRITHWTSHNYSFRLLCFHQDNADFGDGAAHVDSPFHRARDTEVLE